MKSGASLQTIRPKLARVAPTALAVALLAACNAPQTATPPSTTDDNTINLTAVTATRYDYALTVKANSNTTVGDLERRYVGKVIAIHADAGFAIMGLTQSARDKLSTSDLAVMSIEANKNTVKSPASFKSAAWSAWSGGWSAWSGGWSAWSGGTGSALSPAENAPIWNQVQLQNAQTLAPQLGKGVTVAVIDTGVDLTHPAFTGRLSSTKTWYDWIGNDTSPQEAGVQGTDPAYGHGTSVAGIVAQVAPSATIMPLRVLAPDGSGDITNIVAAVEWAVNNGAKVINLSLGSTIPTKTLDNQIAWAGQKGVLVVASSGNTGDTSITYPAAYSEDTNGALEIGVGSVSTNSYNVKSVFSTFEGNSKTGIELTAPGEYVYGPYPGGKLAYWSGTSMAAPMVSGSLALALGTPQGAALPKSAVMDHLTRSATSTDAVNPSYVGKLGSGCLNAALFVRAVLDDQQ